MTPEQSLLFDRLVSSEASPEEWSAWVEQVGDDVDAWRLLAAAYRNEALLDRLAADDAGVADEVAPPSRAASSRRWVGPLAFSTGWLAAAAVLIVTSVLSMRSGTDAGTEYARPAVTPIAANADDALQLYLERGRDEGSVVEELPTRLLVDYRPLEEDGGYEVLYVRQILEKTIVPELYAPTASDDSGAARLTRFTVNPSQAF